MNTGRPAGLLSSEISLPFIFSQITPKTIPTIHIDAPIKISCIMRNIPFSPAFTGIMNQGDSLLYATEPIKGTLPFSIILKLPDVIIPDVHDIVDRRMIAQAIQRHCLEVTPAPAAENGGGMKDMTEQP